MGVRVHLRAETGGIGISTILQVSPEWTPELSREVDALLARSGLRELREGVWGPAETDEDSLRGWEESARSTAKYQDIWRTVAEHPDWSDQDVAESCGVSADDVAYYRAEWNS
jgi:hypothetical protein